MCKPKNRVVCPDCGREKIIFDSEKKAQRFIDYNWEELVDDKDKLRIYYCPACCAYHISSHKFTGNNARIDRLIKLYNSDKKITPEFVKLKDDCLSKNFKNRKDFLSYVQKQEVSDYKIIQRVISYFDSNYKFS